MESCRLLRNILSRLPRKLHDYGPFSTMIRYLHETKMDLDQLIKVRMRKQLLSEGIKTSDQSQIDVINDPIKQPVIVEIVPKQDLAIEQQKNIKGSYIVTFRKSHVSANKEAVKISGFISVTKNPS